MRLLEKLKTIKRKWIYLIAAVLVVVLVGGIAAVCVHERFDGRDGEKGINSYQTYYDLLYLENTDNMKISPAQAKVLLPLVQKLSTADEETQKSLVYSIYKQFTPQQYYSILNEGRQTNIEKGNERWGSHGREPRGNFERGHIKGKTTTLSDPINDIVLNMLKDLSLK